MAQSGEQLDKDSLKYLIISPVEKKDAKREHKRKKRREAKNIDNENPQYNRYGGWVG